MPDLPRIERIATDGPFVALSGWGVWRIELGEAYLNTRYWSIGDRVMIAEGTDEEDFTHQLTNVDAPGESEPVAAHRLASWPAGRGPESA